MRHITVPIYCHPFALDRICSCFPPFLILLKSDDEIMLINSFFKIQALFHQYPTLYKFVVVTNVFIHLLSSSLTNSKKGLYAHVYCLIVTFTQKSHMQFLDMHSVHICLESLVKQLRFFL